MPDHDPLVNGGLAQIFSSSRGVPARASNSASVKIVLLGAGGHAKVVASSVRRLGWELLGHLDDGRAVGETLGSSRVLGSIASLLEYPEDVAALVGLGDNRRRQEVYEWLRGHGRSAATVIDPHAVLEESVKVGAGTVIMPGVIINVDTVIGENCILNTGCSVDHDCRLANHVHLCPGTHLAGVVSVGQGTMLGTGTSVIQCRNIGAHCVIGAGSVVNRDIPDGVTAYGVPCRVNRGRE